MNKSRLDAAVFAAAAARGGAGGVRQVLRMWLVTIRDYGLPLGDYDYESIVRRYRMGAT